MFEGTRIARIQKSVEGLRSGGTTRIAALTRRPRPSVEGLFREKQRMMASAVREERRPGLFVFAAHLQYGHVARLWLEASPHPRAGLIGRHDGVDLALPLDDALSLRHLLFVVRREQQTVKLVVLDLETPHGLQLESGEAARLVEATGPLVLSASDFIFFCFPTGEPLPWNPDCGDPWLTLPRRKISRVVPPGRQLESAVVGRVELTNSFGTRAASFGTAALARGVLVGRAERCDLVEPTHTVSRVHVVLLRLDDELFVIDAGSTNGTWNVERQVHLARLRDGDVLTLGEEVTLSWRDAH